MTHQELLLHIISEARDFHGTGDEEHQYESIEIYCAEWIMQYAAEQDWTIPDFNMKAYKAYLKEEDYPDDFEWFDEYVTVLERLEFEDGYAEQVPEAFARTEAFKNHIFYEMTAEEIRVVNDETLLKLY
jgi:hypothetical protein